MFSNLKVFYHTIRILHCPNCNHHMMYNHTTEKWKCHNYQCGTSRSCTCPFSIPKNNFQKYPACIFLYAVVFLFPRHRNYSIFPLI